jgi:hypothetical protein
MQLSKVMTFGLTLALVATVIAPLSARAESALSAAPSDNSGSAPAAQAAVAPALSAAPQSNEAPAPTPVAPASNPSGSGSPLSSAGQTNEAVAPALSAAPQSNEVKQIPSNPSGSGNPAAAPQSNEVSAPTLTSAPQNNEVKAPTVTAAPQSNEVKTPATPTTPTTPSGASSGSGAPASGGGNGPISGSFGGGNGGGAAAITPGSTGGVTGGSIITTAGTCAPIITSTLKIAGKNDANQVRRVQNFLNTFEKANIAITGVYDTATIEAVEDFQVKYRSEVLAPWGATLPSGEIYITTRNKMNDLYCGTKATLTAAESAKIAAFRAAIAAGGIMKNNTEGQPEITNPENGTTVPAEIGANTSSTTVAQKPGFFRNTASAIMAVPKAIGSFFSKLFKRN